MSRHQKNKKSTMSASEMVDYIKRNLGYKSYAKPPLLWLNTRYKELNKVLGSKKLGIAYGKLVLLAGKPSSGKSALAAWITGLAQKDGAEAAWVDGENSYDPRHVSRQGVNPNEVALFEPEYGEFGYKSKKVKNKLIKADVEAAEDVFNRVEIWMKLAHKQNPEGKRIVVVDSTTSFSPEEELAAGLNEQNMRTRTSSAVFLNNLTKRWQGLAARTNTLVIFIAQLRTSPGVMFGNPEYVTGGNGLQYYSHIVVWMRRIKDGEIKSKGVQVGTRGLLSNRKNKAGGGSIERKKCGYYSYFYENKWKFVSAEEIKKGDSDAGE